MKKVLSFLLMALAFQFILCHMSAQIALLGSFTEGMMSFYLHIISAPFDILYFDLNVYLFGWLIFGLLNLSRLTKAVMPRAEMKGEEHGSNDFQGREEMQLFGKNCTTEVLAYTAPIKEQSV